MDDLDRVDRSTSEAAGRLPSRHDYEDSCSTISPSRENSRRIPRVVSCDVRIIGVAVVVFLTSLFLLV